MVEKTRTLIVDCMHWREQVAQLEREGNFDIAVFLLEKIIKESPDEMDAYIILLHRFMDSCLENPIGVQDAPVNHGLCDH